MSAALPFASAPRVLGILGYPVRHTLSPRMYNPLFLELGLNLLYLPMEVAPERLGEAVSAIRALGLVGVHVTVPHKEAIIPHLDELTGGAGALGAVNVVVNREGVLCGMNSDGPGYMASLIEETGYQPGGQAVILGAGGSARAIAGSLGLAGVKRVSILNRDEDRARRLAEALGEYLEDVTFEGLPLNSTQFAKAVEDAGLVVSCTRPEAYEIQRTMPFEGLKPGTILSDINYYSGQTPLEEVARRLGLSYHPGLGMLASQAAISLEWLLGIRVESRRLSAYLTGATQAGMLKKRVGEPA